MTTYPDWPYNAPLAPRPNRAERRAHARGRCLHPCSLCKAKTQDAA